MLWNIACVCSIHTFPACFINLPEVDFLLTAVSLPLALLFLLLHNIYQTICFVIASINYDSCEHRTLAAVATDYNKTVITSAAILYRKCKFGFLILLFGIFCDEKAFDRASYWQVTIIPYHMKYLEFLIRL